MLVHEIVDSALLGEGMLPALRGVFADGGLVGAHAAAVPARASYVYAAVRGAPSAAAVSFPDGRPFHDLDLATGDSGELAHACAPDAYTGRVIATGAHTLTVEWRVTGPAKDYAAVTQLSREL